MKLLAKKNWETGIMKLEPQPVEAIHVEKYQVREVWHCDHCNTDYSSEKALLQHHKRDHPGEFPRYKMVESKRLVKRTLMEREIR